MSTHEKGFFYLKALGLLMQDTKFTPEEEGILDLLCRAASQSDAVFWDLTRSIEPGTDLADGLERLKDTFRRLGKAEILQAYHDRAAHL